MIHPLAHIDDTVRIGIAPRIWQFASVIRNAWIGDDCNIASCALIDGAHVGDRCSVAHAAALFPGTKLGNDVFIGPGAMVCNDLWPETSKEGFELGGVTVVIDDGASLGAGAVILPGVRVGRNALVAAGAVVDRNVPDGFLWRRNGYLSAIPANRRTKRMRWAC